MSNKKITIPIIAALVVAIISLGVAFAAFSAVLTINGNATIEASSWDIHFSETEKTSTAGSGAAPAQGGVTIYPESQYLGTAESTLSTLTRDTFTWSGTFKTPGDTLEYHFWIVNAGDYNATLSAPEVNQPTCKISGVTQQSCPIIYSVTKSNGDPFTGSDNLAAGASVAVVVKAQLDPNYGGDGSELSNVDIDVSMYTVTFTYTQNGAAGGSAQSGGGSGSGSGSGGGQVASAQYARSYVNGNYDLVTTWEDDIPTVDNETVSIYAKKVGNTVYLCGTPNNSELCFTYSDYDSLEQLCPGTYNFFPSNEDLGNYGNDYIANEKSCVVESSGINYFFYMRDPDAVYDRLNFQVFTLEVSTSSMGANDPIGGNWSVAPYCQYENNNELSCIYQ